MSYVLTCDTCCRTKRGPLPLQAGLEVLWNKSHSDYLSTLPFTESMNEYILMMVDSFTKWADWCPSPPKPRSNSALQSIRFSLGLGIILRYSLIKRGTLTVNCSKNFVSFCKSTSRVPSRIGLPVRARWSGTTALLWTQCVVLWTTKSKLGIST